jgi:hypothetical protein
MIPVQQRRHLSLLIPSFEDNRHTFYCNITAERDGDEAMFMPSWLMLTLSMSHKNDKDIESDMTTRPRVLPH